MQEELRDVNFKAVAMDNDEIGVKVRRGGGRGAGVSVELSVSFLSAAPAGATIFVEGRVLKTGKRLGFTTVDIFRHDAATGKRIDVATGRHTKSLG